MKILHLLGGSPTGGAALGTKFLHEGLLALGADSRVVGTSSSGGGGLDPYRPVPSLFPATLERQLRSKLEQSWIRLLYSRPGNEPFSPSLLGPPIGRSRWYKTADLLHVHWAGFGSLRLEDILRFSGPVVITLRDLWPVTGGCHYPLACEGYQKRCGSCPQIGPSRFGRPSTFDISAKGHNRRKSLFAKLGPRLVFVAMTPWAEMVLRSATVVAESNSIRAIPNAVEVTSLGMLRTDSARRDSNINSDAKICLVSAQSPNLGYKGMHVAVQALSKLPPEWLVFAFGHGSHWLARQCRDRRVRPFGFIRDRKLLGKLYSAADVYLLPSVQETFGKTVIESLYCRTPVAAFRSTGPGSLVKHGVTGVLADPFSAEALADAAQRATTLRHQRAFQVAVDELIAQSDPNAVARKHLSLYEEALAATF